jgi:hypothetical protein
MVLASDMLQNPSTLKVLSGQHLTRNPKNSLYPIERWSKIATAFHIEEEACLAKVFLKTTSASG